MSERIQKVLANCEQGLSTTEKAQARRNIDAQATLVAGNNITIDPATNEISAADSVQVQSNWNETDSGDPSYIQNKPDVPEIVRRTASTPSTETSVDKLAFVTNGRVMGDSAVLGLIAPEGSQPQAGKVLTLHYSGSPGLTTAQWDDTQAPDISLIQHGQAGIEETPVDKLEFDFDFGTVTADGTDVGLVAPVPQSGDNGKTIRVNYDTLEYVDMPKGVFYGRYTGSASTNTPFSDYYNAYNEGKGVFMVVNVLGGDKVYELDQIDSTRAVFRRTLGSLVNGNYGNVASEMVLVYQSDNSYLFKSCNIQGQITAGYMISLTPGANSTTVVSNAMHPSTISQCMYYDTLVNVDDNDVLFGPWRVSIHKDSITAWGSGGFHVRITYINASASTVSGGSYRLSWYYPYKDATVSEESNVHYTYSGTDPYADAGHTYGYPIVLVTPDRAEPEDQSGYRLRVDSGKPYGDWIDISFEVRFIGGSAAPSSNSIALILKGSYAYHY